MRPAIAVLLIAAASSLFAAAGDVALSPTTVAPLPGVHHVALASSGREYLVAFGFRGGIYWQRVGFDGTPIDAHARRLDGAELALGMRDDWIKVVWTDETYFLVWNEPGNQVVAQPIDPEGVVTEAFTVTSGMTLRDAARWGGEVAILSSVGGTHRFSLFNPYGAPLGSHVFSTSFLNDVSVVRLDEGWTVVSPAPAGGLTIVNPKNGDARVVSPNRMFAEVYASPAAGALATTLDDTVGVLTRAGAFVPLTLPNAVERLSTSRLALVSPTPSGWAVIYRSGGSQRIATVRYDATLLADRPLSGAFPTSGTFPYSALAAASSREENHLLLQPAPVGTTLGLESIAVAGSQSYRTGTLAISDAVQQWADVAHGPGVDLVVWIESGFQGWDIRATRVQEGLPLDEEGILVGTAFPSSLAAAYDGETFSIAWSDAGGIFTRRLDLLANPVDSAPVQVSPAAAQQVTIAGSGDGGLLVGWPDPRPTVAYVRRGLARNSATVGPDTWNDSFETAGSRDGFLGVFAQLPEVCRITCEPTTYRPVSAQLVSPSGNPIGGPVAITEAMPAVVGKPIAHGGDWFVPVLEADPQTNTFPAAQRVIRVTGSVTSTLGSTPTIEGALRSASGGLAILGERFRGMLGPEPANLWYEPLPLDDGEIAEASMAVSETLLVSTGTRYVLRPLASPTAQADVGLIHTGRSSEGFDVLDSVRIVHRGGDDVALHVDAPFLVASTVPVVEGVIEGPFKEGETIDLFFRRRAHEEPLVVVLPLARETAAADNFLRLEGGDEPPPPASHRRRLVGRP